jgi:hypothetical protein
MAALGHGCTVFAGGAWRGSSKGLADIFVARAAVTLSMAGNGVNSMI